ncbi:MAG: hypothetical protein K6E85_15400 [Lachnospiraceae bacterium]|nr:hypothetical protein [Lachnospiraceae bacterium]
MTDAQQKRFEKIKNEVAGFNRGIAGIGTMGEKSVHAVLKNFYAPSKDTLEVAVNGYVADICDTNTNNIIEIQTRQFYSMKKKLKAFLPEFDVTIVYPLPVQKYVFNIDPETGSVITKRKSPKKRSIYDIFEEMYGIRDYLNDPNLHFKIVCLEAEEYRYKGLSEQHGRKTKILSDIVPVRILEEIDIYETRDLIMFLPEELGNEFTRTSLSAAAGISKALAGYVAALLYVTGLVTRDGTRSNREVVNRINQI